MRVLHVIPSVARQDGGPAAAVVGMCRALRVRGVDARIATTDADGPNRLDVPLGVEQSHDGIPTLFFERRGRDGFKRSPALAAWLERAVGSFDVVHVHAVFSHASLSAGRACRRANVPYVVRPLGTLDPWSLAQKRWQKRMLMLTTVRRLLDGAAAVHFTAMDEQRRAPMRARTRGVVIPLGLDDSAFARPDASEARTATIVSIARLHPKKNIETLIRAFAALPPATRHWTLVIAGDGEPEYRAQLERLAQATSAGERIEFAGWIEPARRTDLLRRASLFALPSRQENFGLSVLEALAQGVPALISDAVNLAPEIEAAHAGWVTADDDAFVKRLADVVNDEDDRRASGVRARAMAERYRWPAIADALVDLYARVAGRPAMPATRVS